MAAAYAKNHAVLSGYGGASVPPGAAVAQLPIFPGISRLHVRCGQTTLKTLLFMGR
jgi:hypothetical protein